MVNEHIARYEQQQGDYDSKQTCQQTNDECLRIEYLRNIFLGGTDCTQNTDFLLSFQYTDIGDNTNHDGRYHKWDGDKGDQYIADNIDNIRHRGHQCTHIIGIGNHLVLIHLLHICIIAIQYIDHLLLAFKILRIDADAARLIQIGISQIF